MRRSDNSEMVAIIGAGWYGSHIALALSKTFTVTLFEKNPDIFSEVSGKFGVRLHAGPHYPRSKATREGCHQGFGKFCEIYPQLINWHVYSIYGLGIRDANNEPPKVTAKKFRQVCEESKECKEVDLASAGYKELFFAMDIKEPSITVGNRLRKTFRELLDKAEVKVVCNFEVTSLQRSENKIVITNNSQESQTFDYVINTTGYQSLLPMDNFPFKAEIVYQPCLALVYKDTKPTSNKPFSFIVMDGWFPCIMPYDDRIEDTEESSKKYILTHGKWTILGSYKTPHEANNRLTLVDEKFINIHVKPLCEHEIIRFWPEFEKRFQYLHWVGAVLAKIKTEREFRSAVTFQHQPSGVIFVIPGKVSNIFDAEQEALALIQNQNVIHQGNYRYIKEGVLGDSIKEITEQPIDPTRNTCELQPYQDVYAAMRRDSEEKESNTSDLFILGLLGLSIMLTFHASNEQRHNHTKILGIAGITISGILLLSRLPGVRFITNQLSLSFFRLKDSISSLFGSQSENTNTKIFER